MKRSLTVFEHETLPVIDDPHVESMSAGSFLTRKDYLLAVKTNDLRPGFCQPTAGGVRFSQYCGLVSLATCTLEVLPKVGFSERKSADDLRVARRALLSMLQSANRLTLKITEKVNQSLGGSPILDIFVRDFLLQTLDKARGGLKMGYNLRSERLAVLKGRFEVTEHFRRSTAMLDSVHCEYDDFTADNALNRVIVAAIFSCKPWLTTPQTARLWHEASAHFSAVKRTTLKASDASKLRPLNRTNVDYDSILKWCEWLLSLSSPLNRAGASPAVGLLFDMNKLFEMHVLQLARSEADYGEVVVDQGPSRWLASTGAQSVFQLSPDISVWRRSHTSDGSFCCRIIDAKWKRLNLAASDWGVSGDDVYQMLAYAIRYGCSDLTLAYPAPEGASVIDGPNFKIRNGESEITLNIKLVDIAGSTR